MCGMPMGLTALAGSLILRLTHGPWPCGRLKPYTTNPTHPTQACTSHHTCSPVESASDRKAVTQTGFQAPVPAPRTRQEVKPYGLRTVRS